MCYTKWLCSLRSFHSFVPKAQFVLCCGGGKLLRLWLWCPPRHSFPERAWSLAQPPPLRMARSDPIPWTWSAQSSALTSQRLPVGNAAFYNVPARKRQTNEQKACLGAYPMNSQLRRAFSIIGITQILHSHPVFQTKTKV